MRERDLLIAGETESVCPVCLERLNARRILDGDRVLLAKNCPEHGYFETVIWQGPPSIDAWLDSGGMGYPQCVSGSANYAHREPCPASVVMELTNACNLKCPVCFTDSKISNPAGPGLKTLVGRFANILDTAGPCNIQLSGGEPTLRDDLPAILEAGRNTGFTSLQLHTNGLRLAFNREYAFTLKKAGLSSVFLQFDGYDDWVHWYLRGKPITEEKVLAAQHCGEAGLEVILVPTLVRRLNDKAIGSIIQLALHLGPAIKGVHFQPLSCLGRYPAPYENGGRMTLPEIMREIEEQTGHLIRADQLFPPACGNVFCSFRGNFIRTPDGSIRPAADHASGNCFFAPNGADGKERKYGYFQTNGSLIHYANENISPVDPAANSFTVSCMILPDPWTIDLRRPSGCCISVVAPDGRLVPFSTHNLGNFKEQSVYRNAAWC
jgi:7,8-dihydro-6-hydroxymethylpterin dimethyltransferase